MQEAIHSNDKKYSHTTPGRSQTNLCISINPPDMPKLHPHRSFPGSSLKSHLSLTNHVHEERRISTILMRYLIWATPLKRGYRTLGGRTKWKFTTEGSSGHPENAVTRLGITERETPRHFPEMVQREIHTHHQQSDLTQVTGHESNSARRLPPGLQTYRD